MKKSEYLKELRGLTAEGLAERRRGLSEERMKLRFRKASGQLSETHRASEIKRQLAQLETVVAEKGL